MVYWARIDCRIASTIIFLWIIQWIISLNDKSFVVYNSETGKNVSHFLFEPRMMTWDVLFWSNVQSPTYCYKTCETVNWLLKVLFIHFYLLKNQWANFVLLRHSKYCFIWFYARECRRLHSRYHLRKSPSLWQHNTRQYGLWPANPYIWSHWSRKRTLFKSENELRHSC